MAPEGLYYSLHIFMLYNDNQLHHLHTYIYLYIYLFLFNYVTVYPLSTSTLISLTPIHYLLGLLCCHICRMRQKGVLVNYKNFGTLSIHINYLFLNTIPASRFHTITFISNTVVIFERHKKWLHETTGESIVLKGSFWQAFRPSILRKNILFQKVN